MCINEVAVRQAPRECGQVTTHSQHIQASTQNKDVPSHTQHRNSRQTNYLPRGVLQHFSVMKKKKKSGESDHGLVRVEQNSSGVPPLSHATFPLVHNIVCP